MKQILTITTALVSSLPFVLNAEPRVITDIAPVHGLVSRVMDGVGSPDLLVDQQSSPHGFSLRVSQANALQNADVVFWVGEGLTPWLEEPLETIAANAKHVELMEAEGLTRLSYRDDHDDHDDHEGHDDHDDHKDHDDHDHDEHKDDDHAEHDHDDDHKEDAHKHDDHDDDHDGDHKEDGHDDHAHDDHDHDKEHDDHAKDEGHKDHDDHDHDKDHDDHAKEEGHDDHDDHEDHAKEEGHDDHAHHHHHHGDGDDPHMWLDPSNASIWMKQIAKTLGEIDPENAATYTKNAEEGAAELAALNTEVAATLASVTDKPYVVLHDAYQYFENAYGLSFAGSVLDESGASQGPKHLEEVRAQIQADGVKCIFLEPQLSTAQVETVSENLDLASATIDPLGANLELGAGFYPALIRSLADSMTGCLNR